MTAVHVPALQPWDLTRDADWTELNLDERTALKTR